MLHKRGLLPLDAANCEDFVMVLLEKSDRRNIWTFAKPFNLEMWFTTGGVIIYTVLVVWLIEHKKHTESSGELLRKIWSAVTNMSIARDFKIETKLARCVVAIWLLVMYIITNSYITNLNSMLNAQNVNVNKLYDRNAIIGYFKHHSSQSHLDGYENLKVYTTEEECEQALSEGPSRGGVGVILMNPLDALHFVSQRPVYTFYDIPPEADTPRSLGVKDFSVWFILTGAVSSFAFIFKMIIDPPKSLPDIPQAASDIFESKKFRSFHKREKSI